MVPHDNATRLTHRSMNRRALARAALAVPALALMGKVRLAQLPPGTTITGDCQYESGVALHVAVNLGQPVIPVADLLPPLDWQRYVNVQTGVTFLHPPTWIAGTLWAEQFSATGRPLWTTQQPFLPALTTSRVVSPDGSAAFESVVGTLPAVLFTPLQAATVAELGMAGEMERSTPICSMENLNPLSPSWFRALSIDASVLITEGFAIPTPGPFGSGTVVSYYAMIGPRAEFESLMREVFLRILTQFLTGRGSESTPTPIPTD